MKSQFIRHLFKVIITLIFSLHFVGCSFLSPTKPNTPYSGNSYPVVLNEIKQTNPLLVKELGRLPEFQDGVSELEESALTRIIDLYKSNPAEFDKAFNKMYKVGLPEYRKYCSPLQALYWLAEDGLLVSEKDLITLYTLKKLLDKAWKTDPLENRIL